MSGRGCRVPIGEIGPNEGEYFGDFEWMWWHADDKERRRGMEDIDSDVNSSLSVRCEGL